MDPKLFAVIIALARRYIAVEVRPMSSGNCPVERRIELDWEQRRVTLDPELLLEPNCLAILIHEGAHVLLPNVGDWDLYGWEIALAKSCGAFDEWLSGSIHYGRVIGNPPMLLGQLSQERIEALCEERAQRASRLGHFKWQPI